jgi:hypothetical protein
MKSAGPSSGPALGEDCSEVEHRRSYSPAARPATSHQQAPPIRADLTGSNFCAAFGLTAKAPAPVLALCRRLLGAGYDPSRPLHAFRGTTLALRVSSIGEGARLTVRDNRHGSPVFVRRQDRASGDVAAPPIAPIELPTGLGAAP